MGLEKALEGAGIGIFKVLGLEANFRVWALCKVWDWGFRVLGLVLALNLLGACV